MTDTLSVAISPRIVPSDEFRPPPAGGPDPPPIVPWQDSIGSKKRYRGAIETLTSLPDRLRRIPSVLADGAFALVMLALAEASSDPAQRYALLSLAIVAVETLPLTLRRRAPVTVLITVASASLAHLVFGFHNGFFDTFAVAVALYTVAAESPRRQSLAFLAILPVGLALALLIDWHNQGRVNLVDIPYNLLLFLSAWLLGDNVRTRRAYLAELEQRQQARERERLEHARASIAEERATIARELHDIVAHSVSVMVLQANAGERILSSRPEDVRSNLAAIQATGREAMSELRRVLGVLRGADPSVDGTAPPPSLADLETLAAETRQAGLATTIRIEGDPSTYPEALQLSAYRVVQEALTNTLRHAGASRADVLVRCDPRRLELEIVDDGRGPLRDDGNRMVGHGLAGIGERVKLFGGDFRAGPLDTGGFRVQASFSVDGRGS